MAMDDFASASDPKAPGKEIDLDEDLFDFPPIETEEASAASVEAAPAEAAPAPTAAPETTSAPSPTAASPSAAASAGYTGMDPDLDVDIFDFPPIEDDAAPPSIAGGDLEASLDEAAETVHTLIEDDLGEMIQEHHEELERQKVEAEAPPAPPEPEAPQPAASTPTPASLPAVAVSAGSSRTQQVLVGAVILFMVGVLSIAWRLTSTFSQSLERVRDDVEAGNRTLSEQSLAQLQRIDELEAELVEQQRRAARAETEGHAAVPAMRSPIDLTLLSAESAIEDGDFAAAREILYGDLASIDALPTEMRAGAAERMEFMIARSYELEARRLGGAQ